MIVTLALIDVFHPVIKTYAVRQVQARVYDDNVIYRRVYNSH